MCGFFSDVGEEIQRSMPAIWNFTSTRVSSLLPIFCFPLTLAFTPFFSWGELHQRLVFFSRVVSHFAHADFSFCVARQDSE